MNRYLSRVSLAAVVVAALAPLCAAEDSGQNPDAQRLPLLKYVEPTYPSRMRINGVTRGEALVWITVDRAGKLLDAYATEFSHESFAESSLAAIKSWEFAPDPEAEHVPRLYPVRFNYFIDGVVVVVMHPSDKDTNLLPLSAPVRDHKSYAFGELDAVPAEVHTPLPQYPEALKTEKKSGRVEVLFFVDPSGRVRVPSVVRSDDPHFAEAAIQAVESWSFEAPKRRGQPVSAFSLHSFTFGPRES